MTFSMFAEKKTSDDLDKKEKLCCSSSRQSFFGSHHHSIFICENTSESTSFFSLALGVGRHTL